MWSKRKKNTPEFRRHGSFASSPLVIPSDVIRVTSAEMFCVIGICGKCYYGTLMAFTQAMTFSAHLEISRKDFSEKIEIPSSFNSRCFGNCTDKSIEAQEN